jgi:hypothetical protein
MGAEIKCGQLPPEEVARQRAETDASYAALEGRYKEQGPLTVPTTKADLTLLCEARPPHSRTTTSSTVQVWFGASVLAWGTGQDRDVWRLDRVSPAEITFNQVSLDWPSWPPAPGEKPDLTEARGHIDRVTGDYSRSSYGEVGECKSAEPKF